MNSRDFGNLHLSASQLREKQIYLMVSFFDEQMHIPDITTVIYLGKDIFHSGDDHHYFQDYALFLRGSNQRESAMIVAPADGLMNFFDLKSASELLMQCACLEDKK